MCVLLPVATPGAYTILGTTMESRWLLLCWGSSLLSEGAWRSGVQRSSEPSPNPRAIQGPKAQTRCRQQTALWAVFTGFFQRRWHRVTVRWTSKVDTEGSLDGGNSCVQPQGGNSAWYPPLRLIQF